MANEGWKCNEVRRKTMGTVICNKGTSRVVVVWKGRSPCVFKENRVTCALEGK